MSARTKLTELCAVKKVKSADDMTDVIRSSGHLLTVLDEHWGLEAALLKLLCGATAESRASSTIMLALPSKDRDMEIAVALSVLEGHASSAAMKLSPPGVQASLKFIVTHLTNLNLGISMGVDLASCSKLARGALQQFEFFCVVDIGCCGAEKKLKGKEAYRRCFEHLLATLESGPVAQELFELLELYQWLAPPDRVAEVTELLKKLKSAAGPAKKKPRTAKTHYGGSSSSTAAADPSKGKAKEKAAAMFR